MRSLVFVALLLAFAAPAWAQTARQLRSIDQELEQLEMARRAPRADWTLGEGARTTWGVYTTFSFLAVDDDLSNTRILRQVDSKIWGQAFWNGHEVFGRLRLLYRDFNSGDSFNGRGDDLAEPLGDRYWYRYRSPAALGAEDGLNWWIQTGRQYIQWEQGVVLSQTLYAVQGGLRGRNFAFRGLIGRTPKTGTIDFDSSRPQFDQQTDRVWWGALVEYTGSTRHKPFIYFLDQTDENGTMALFGGVPTVWIYDSSYAAIGSNGSFSGVTYYRAELIYEWGTGASDSLAGAQTLEDISAWALRFNIVFIPHNWRPRQGRFEIELLIGSGDDDRGQSAFTPFGNTSGTDDNSFNAFGYVNTGYALSPALANLISLRFGYSTIPVPKSRKFGKLQLLLDFFIFSTLDSNAATSVPTNRTDSFIGVEFDVALTWEILSDLYFDLRYGVFFPGDAMPAGFDDPRHFFYVGVSYAF